MLKSTKVPMINPKTGKVVGINVMDVQAALNNKYTYPEQEKTPPQSVAVDDSEGDEEDFDADLNETIGDFMERKTGEKPPVVEAAKQSLPEQQTTTAKEEQKTPPTDTVVPLIKPVASTTAPVIGVAPVEVDRNKKLLDELGSVKKPAKEKTELEKALELQKMLQVYSIISRGSEKIGAGLSGLISRGDAPKIGDDTSDKLVQELGKTQVEQAKEADKLAKEEAESDPESDKSKSVQRVLMEYGAKPEFVKDITYKDYKDLGLANLLYKFKSLESKEEQAKKTIESKEKIAEERLTAQKQMLDQRLAATERLKSQAADLAKSRDQGKYIATQNDKTRSSKEFSALMQAKRSADKAEDVIKNSKDNAIVDIQLMYDTIKALDPNSAVKGGEVELVRSAINAWGNLTLKLDQYRSQSRTRLLTPEVRKELTDLITELRNAYMSDYNTMIKSKAQVASEYYNLPYEKAYSSLDVLNPRTYDEPSKKESGQTTPSSEVIEKNGLRLRPKN